MSSFAERLEEAMKEKGITQKALSVEIGISDAYMSQMSTGKRIPSPRTNKDLAEALGVNAEWLSSGEGPKKAEQSREEAIAEIVEKILKDKPDGFRERFIKMFASLTYEEMQLLEKVIDTLASKK